MASRRHTIKLSDAIKSPLVVTGVAEGGTINKIVLIKMNYETWPVAVQQVDCGIELGCGLRTFAEEVPGHYVHLDFTDFGGRGEVQAHACISPSSSLVSHLEESSDFAASSDTNLQGEGVQELDMQSAPGAGDPPEVPSPPLPQLPTPGVRILDAEARDAEANAGRSDDVLFPPTAIDMDMDYPLVRILDAGGSAKQVEEPPSLDVADSAANGDSEILRQGAPGQVVVPEWSGPGSSSTSESGEDTFGETAEDRDEGDGQRTCEQEGQEPVGLYEVESIIGRRSNPSKKIVEFLVKWKGYDASHCTWEPRRRLPSGVVGTYEADNGFRYVKRTRCAAEDESKAAIAAVVAERTPRSPPTHCSVQDLGGSRVRVFWKQEGTYFWGTLASSTFTAYTIVYDDGETEEVTLPDEEITLWEGGAAGEHASSSARDYADLVGCRVRVYWRSERTCYWGELHTSPCVAYKIEYDDGDDEEVTLPDPDIQVMPAQRTPTKQPLVTKRACAPDHAPSTPVKHPRTKPTTNYVGQRVRAYWNREKEWSEGFLSHFNAKSGRYTISYDDGSFEEGVPVPDPSIEFLGDD